MSSDTFAAGIEAIVAEQVMFADANLKVQHRPAHYAGYRDASMQILAAIRALTPTASEATAIGAGEARAWLYERDACASVVEKADHRWKTVFGWTETPLFAASPKVASDTAPDLCRKDGQPCYVGGGTDDAHYRCGTVQCGMRKTSDTDTAIPAGWKLVPVEPTDAMVDAGWALVPNEADDWDIPTITDVWAAMLAASPKPDTDTPVDPGVERVREAVRMLFDTYMQERALKVCGGNADIAEETDAFLDSVAALAAKPITGMDAGEVERLRDRLAGGTAMHIR